jgi:hypothetical protein
MSRGRPDDPDAGNLDSATLAAAPPGEPATVAPDGRAPTPPGWPARIGGYEVLEELGRGGMGVVYKARQIGLDRVVALKMILSGSHASADQLVRFRTEAEAIARLQHPNIVQVHEVGEHEGRPFFSMEFFPGGSLEKKLAGTPLPPPEAARLAEVLARAMHAAHRQQVIHRDLKPGNVMLAEDGTPKVTDFGLAKKLDDVGQTGSNAVLGTPSYMAPEQAGGKSKDIGPLADVYALGAILYECLTGRPPFKAATPLDTILQVVSDEPVPPRQLQSKVPRDLETICLKCLQKDPRKRYPSAEELAEDLRRFLYGKPILARPVGALGRCWRWCRRNPAVASLTAAVVAAVLLGTALAAFFAVRATREAERADERARAATDAEGQAMQGAADLREQLLLSNTLLYAGKISLAQREWQDGNLGRARELLAGCPPELCGWEHRYLRGQCAGTPLRLKGLQGSLFAFAFSADGRKLATAEARAVKVWDARTGRLERTFVTGREVLALALRHDGKRLAAGGPESGQVTVWDLATGKAVQKYRHQVPAKAWGLPDWYVPPVNALAFSPDGASLASVASVGPVLVWDTAGKQRLGKRQDRPPAGRRGQGVGPGHRAGTPHAPGAHGLGLGRGLRPHRHAPGQRRGSGHRPRVGPRHRPGETHAEAPRRGQRRGLQPRRRSTCHQRQ